MVKNIIMLSGKAQSGKDTFFGFFSKEAGERGLIAERFAFADALKRIATTFGWKGTKEGDGRNFLIDVGQILRGDYALELGVVGGLLQARSLLTGEIIERETYSLPYLYSKLTEVYIPCKDFWVKRAYEDMKASKSDYAVITDWRFQNEFFALKKLVNRRIFRTPPVTTIRIENFRSLAINDPSELDLDKFQFDMKIANNGTFEAYGQSVKEMASAIGK